VRRCYGGRWAEALAAFVRDPTNRYCPTWIRRNYDALNKALPDPDAPARAAAVPSAPRFVFDEDDEGRDGGGAAAAEPAEAAAPDAAAPAAAAAANADAPPPDTAAADAHAAEAERLADALLSGEPPVAEDDAHRPESYMTDHHWTASERPAWQRHSELGPNLECEAGAVRREPGHRLVNPPDADYTCA
jgi:hypothetical protein